MSERPNQNCKFYENFENSQTHQESLIKALMISEWPNKNCENANTMIIRKTGKLANVKRKQKKLTSYQKYIKENCVLKQGLQLNQKTSSVV